MPRSRSRSHCSSLRFHCVILSWPCPDPPGGADTADPVPRRTQPRLIHPTPTHPILFARPAAHLGSHLLRIQPRCPPGRRRRHTCSGPSSAIFPLSRRTPAFGRLGAQAQKQGLGGRRPRQRRVPGQWAGCATDDNK